MERHFTFECDGVAYEQNYLVVEDSTKLHELLAKKGFVAVMQAAQALLKEGDNLVDAMSSNEAKGEALIAGAYELIQRLEAKDVADLQVLFSRYTWVDVAGGQTKQRLDATKHFVDARDMARLYKFIFESCKMQMAPLWTGLSTGLTRLTR